MSPEGRKGATIVMETGSLIFTGFFAGQGIDKREKMWYFFCTKCCDEDTRSGKIPREEAILVQGFRTPADADTTSELPGGNTGTGAPVIASMSDGRWP